MAHNITLSAYLIIKASFTNVHLLKMIFKAPQQLKISAKKNKNQVQIWKVLPQKQSGVLNEGLS